MSPQKQPRRPADEARGDAAENTEKASTPIFVTQKSVEAIVGICGREYMRGAREGFFDSTKDHRTIVARTVDVIAAYEARLTRRVPVVAMSEADALARAGFRRIAS